MGGCADQRCGSGRPTGRHLRPTLPSEGRVEEGFGALRDYLELGRGWRETEELEALEQAREEETAADRGVA